MPAFVIEAGIYEALNFSLRPSNGLHREQALWTYRITSCLGSGRHNDLLVFTHTYK